MQPDKIAALYRLYGDATNVVSRFDDIQKKIVSMDPAEDKEIFYHLRRIVDICDKISSEIETTFKDEVPNEV